MKRVTLNPPGLAPSRSYSQIMTVEDAKRIIYISGQIADDEQGNLVAPGDFRGQLVAIYRNLERALAAAGAGWEHVLKTTTYVVDYRPALRPILHEVRLSVIPREHLPASTLVGVTALAEDGWLVEIEAIAAL